MDANDHIRNAIERLADARRNAEGHRGRLREANTAFELEHAPLIAVSTAANAAALVAEQEVRELLTAHYHATGETRPVPGAEVVLRSEYAIDEAAGLLWAQSTGLALLPARLDLAAAKKIARATPLPFVVETKVPSVRIASDLDAALAEVAV